MTQKSNPTPPHQRKAAELSETFVLLNDKDLVHRALELTPEDQMKFLDDIDQVRKVVPFQETLASLVLQRRIVLSILEM